MVVRSEGGRGPVHHRPDLLTESNDSQWEDTLLRERLGDRYRIGELHDGIEYLPVVDDPLEGAGR